MQKKAIFISLSILANVVLCYVAFPRFLNNKATPDGESAPHYTVAIIATTLSPAAQRVVTGLSNTLSTQGNAHYSIVPYINNGDRTLLRSQVEEILSSSYDIIKAH